MKYIKLFETVRVENERHVRDLTPENRLLYDNMRFKLGDVVKVKPRGSNLPGVLNKKLYKVVIVDFDAAEYDDRPYYIEEYDGGTHFSTGWKTDDELIKVEDYENGSR